MQQQGTALGNSEVENATEQNLWLHRVDKGKRAPNSRAVFSLNIKW